MYNITLLSSFHIQLGKCNSNELYKIIEKIQPEIIFEELPQDIFDIIYSEGYNPESLEAIAIKKYLEKYQTQHIPVDTYEFNETDIFNGYDIISNKSREYSELFNQHLSMISEYGYPFFNSNKFAEQLDKMLSLERKVLLEIDDPKLSNQYKLDSEVHDKRETEMLQNIYNYSKQHQYNEALLICGTEHRKSLMDKMPKFEKDNKLKLNWVFNYFD